MTLEQLQKQKKDLEQIQEYQCGDHPTRILCVSNISHKDLPTLHSLLNSQNLQNHPHIKTFYDEEIDTFHFVLISFYDLRQSISTHKMLLKTQKYQVHYALAKDVLDDKEQNQGTIVVFNIEYSVTNEEIKELFGTCGDIKELRETPLKKHHRFVEYFDLRDAQRAISELNQFELKGRKLKIEPSRPNGIRQRVLTSCANILGMKKDICGLPPPAEMMKFVNRKIDEIQNESYFKRRNNSSNSCNNFNSFNNCNNLNNCNTFNSSNNLNNSNNSNNLNNTHYVDLNEMKKYSYHSNSNGFKHNMNDSSKSWKSKSSYQTQNQMFMKSNPNEKREVQQSKSPLTLSKSSVISLDCLSSLPSITSSNEMNQNESLEKQSQHNQMFYDLYQSSSINSFTQNNSFEVIEINELETSTERNAMNEISMKMKEMNKFNEITENEPIKPLQIESIPNNSKSSNSLMKKKEEITIITVPKPTSIGQELSHQYSKETIGTPHLPEKKYNYFDAIEMKGLGLEKEEDIDEMKRVLVIENIPITFTYHELVNRIEQCISCFYDQFFPIKNKDGLTYKCIIRVTNQMVMDNFMLHFNGIFLENDQDDLCVVHEIHCQGGLFSKQLKSLMV